MISRLDFLLFIICYPLFVVIDALWIGVIMKRGYMYYLKDIARTSQDGSMSFNIPSALLVWALIVFGAILFLLPRIIDTSLPTALLWGGLYGLVLYGVYDLTNYATLAHWSAAITIIDILWGIAVNAFLAFLLRLFHGLLRSLLQ